MAFKFRLEKVLSIRLREQDEASRKNALAQQRLVQARNALVAVEEDKRCTEENLERIKREDILDAKTLHLHALRFAGLAVDIEKAVVEIARANNEARIAAEILAEVHKSVEILKKLRERDEKEYNANLQKKERAEMDEIAVTRFRMKEVVK